MQRCSAIYSLWKYQNGKIQTKIQKQKQNAGHLNLTSLPFPFAVAFWKERIASKDVERVLKVASTSFFCKTKNRLPHEIPLPPLQLFTSLNAHRTSIFMGLSTLNIDGLIFHVPNLWMGSVSVLETTQVTVLMGLYKKTHWTAKIMAIVHTPRSSVFCRAYNQTKRYPKYYFISSTYSDTK